MGCGKGGKKRSLERVTLDLSKDKIGDTELKIAIPALKKFVPEEAIKQAAELVFAVYDKDHNGHLDRKELKLFLTHTFKEQEIKFEIDEEYMNQFFKDFDSDKSNSLEKNELAKYMESFFKHLVKEMEKEAKKRGLKINS